MSYFKTRGIVTGVKDLGEADRIMSILTADEGLIRATAKGVRRLKNKLAGASQLFSYGEFQLYPGRELYSVQSCEIFESFSRISNSPELFTYGVHLVKIANDVATEGQNAEEVLSLLLNALYIFNIGQKNPLLVTRIFELRILCLSGYTPTLSNCGVCGGSSTLFSAKANGCVCSNCATLLNDTFDLSKGAMLAIRHICSCDKTRLFSFDVSEEVMCDLNYFLPAYLEKCFEKKYETLDFLELIK
ncbi:MAG: DNA repair protein RecO [Bacillota bacterium]